MIFNISGQTLFVLHNSRLWSQSYTLARAKPLASDPTTIQENFDPVQLQYLERGSQQFSSEKGTKCRNLCLRMSQTSRRSSQMHSDILAILKCILVKHQVSILISAFTVEPEIFFTNFPSRLDVRCLKPWQGLFKVGLRAGFSSWAWLVGTRLESRDHFLEFYVIWRLRPPCIGKIKEKCLFQAKSRRSISDPWDVK